MNPATRAALASIILGAAELHDAAPDDPEVAAVAVLVAALGLALRNGRVDVSTTRRIVLLIEAW